ncbi:unnamed protein product [Nezara viridula]|uniref:C2H2-type domain-containing protein n=1 Tax=Nezara viridula TaxID=85310 RepID=A0A9P0HD13_NEZVI|nr:unnamed protein product [Nezara viridula]
MSDSMLGDKDEINSFLSYKKFEFKSSSFTIRQAFIINGKNFNMKEFTCDCGKTYRHKASLRVHKKYECGGKAPQFECSYCSYKARLLKNLRRHTFIKHVKVLESDSFQ